MHFPLTYYSQVLSNHVFMENLGQDESLQYITAYRKLATRKNGYKFLKSCLVDNFHDGVYCVTYFCNVMNPNKRTDKAGS